MVLMPFPFESAQRTSRRLDMLKKRAQAVLDQYKNVNLNDHTSTIEVTKLLEDLRIYQVELELQNDELRVAQMTADVAQRTYRTLFNQMPLPAFVLDAHGMVDECNDIAIHLMGNRVSLPAQDVRFWHRLDAADRSRLHVALRDVLPGQSQILEKIKLCIDTATTGIFDAHLIGLSIDYKLDRRILLLLVDQSVQQARESERRLYGSLLDATDNVVFATDKQGRMLLANQAMLNHVQCHHDDVIGHRREDFMPLRDAIIHNEADQRALQTLAPVTLEQCTRDSAQALDIDWYTRQFPLLDAEGKVIGVGGVSTNVSTLKTHQREILLSEAVFMNSDESIIITDPKANIIRVNPAFTRLTGFSPDVVLGENTRILKSGRHTAMFYEALWASLVKTKHWAGEINNRRADGTFFTVWANINAVCDEEGRVLHYIGLQSDVTQLHETQLALQHQASYDNLTGLPNRSLFNDRVSQLVAHSLRQKSVFSLLFIDLDHFKEVNDTLGHLVGDILLRNVASRLQKRIRKEDTVARIGGDEFVVLLPGTDRQGAEILAHTILDHLRDPVMLDGVGLYRPMSSIGLAVYPEDGQTPDALLRSADIAMYQAKLAGRNRMLSYTSAMGTSTDLAFTIQTELTRALAENQFCVYFQPKCRLDTGELVGAEALVRWHRPGHGLTMPGTFIGVAEKSGLLVEIDTWVMKDAVRQLGQWQRDGLWAPTMRLAINQNVADLQKPDMLEQLQGILTTHAVSASVLELEITEDALLDHTDEQMARLKALYDMGVSIAIDDFGTGYSSLSYLRLLPVSVIKIDQSFVASMLTDENDVVLVRTIIDMAHDLGHSLVAEGVETLQQRERLCLMGTEVGQGYLFGKPISAEEFEARWLREAGKA